MSDKIRWRYGGTNLVVAAVDSATVVEIGDLVWQDVDDAKPASMVTQGPAGQALMDLTEQKPQDVFTNNFLGVAMQRSGSDWKELDQIRVATTGVFKFDCPSGTFELGDLIGVGYQLCGGHDKVNDGRESVSLLNQQVEKVANPACAIGRVAKRVPTAATGVLVDIRSTVMTGGVLTRSC